jgi:hypothetical protein
VAIALYDKHSTGARACPELVERGRLNLAQDASPGVNLRLRPVIPSGGLAEASRERNDKACALCNVEL